MLLLNLEKFFVIIFMLLQVEISQILHYFVVCKNLV